MKKMILSMAMRRMVLTLSGVAAAMMLSGCPDAAHDQTVDRSGMLSANDQVSNVPWNKPQGWENKSQLGSLANDPRIGGQQ